MNEISDAKKKHWSALENVLNPPNEIQKPYKRMNSYNILDHLQSPDSSFSKSKNNNNKLDPAIYD